MPKPSLTVVIPAYNEQENLKEAVDRVHRIVDGLVDDYEIIIVDDASKDGTFAIAQQESLQDKHIHFLRNDSNQGFGYSFMRGVGAAQKEYIAALSADNDVSWESLRELVGHIGEAHVLSAYMNNPGAREWPRRVISKIFVMLLNSLFGMRLKYFNGPFIVRREDLQALTIRSKGLTVVAECKIKLIKQGHSFLEIPFEHIPRQKGRSTALSFKSLKAVTSAVVRLYRDIYL